MNNHGPVDPRFPPPPWVLRGHGMMILKAMPRRANASALPAGFLLQSLIGGLSFRGYYLAEYETALPPDLHAPWHEWGNVAGYVRTAAGNGFFISGMAADNEAAVRGGREIWGLNKFLADIQMEAAGRTGKAALTASEGQIDLSWKGIGPGMRLSPVFRFVTSRLGEILFYSVTIQGRFHLARARITCRTSPSFPALAEGSFWAVRFEEGIVEIKGPADGCIC
ncbi:MAG TPA: acetoacetate decarboxylase family protein [bacterium]|nr:acetoacetate decarboxylase family protein [bacterium]HOL95329.1 acetoacetate decarboxylase family protein [bacterium]HPO99101.1 acetoacetate decarboxylase family protein [bacterium]